MEMRYFEFVEMLDTVFPSTLECDYTTISPDEMWLRVDNILKSSGIRFSEKEIHAIRDKICSKPPYGIGNQYDLYNRKSYSGNRTQQGDGFDQNHWYIKQNVMEMRCAILHIAHEKLVDRSNFIHMKYSNKIGTYEDIDKHIDREKIYKHISDLMIMSKERRESNYGDLHQLIAAEVCYYYALPVPPARNDVKDHISKLIENAFNKSKIFYDSADGKHKESVMDETLLRDLLSKATEDIVNYLQTLTHSMLRDASDLVRESNNEEIIDNSNNEIFDENIDGNFIEEIDDNDFEDKVEKDNDTAIDNVTEYDMDVLIEKYNKMLLLAEKNKQLTRSLNDIEEKRKQLLAELDKLNYEAEQLKNEINDNNVELGIGKKSGSK